MYALRSTIASLALIVAGAILGLTPGRARAAEGEPAVDCGSRAMYVVAHQDDSLLFQSPTLLQDVRSEGHCVRSVFITAGDAGYGEAYWRKREEGVEAAYAEMLGAADSWAVSTLEAAGHSVRLETLTADPRVSLVFLRLPDGEVDGEGTSAYGFQSLRKLWNGGHGLTPSIVGMNPDDDGSSTYTYAELVATLAALMSGFAPSQIATQNYAEGFFEHGDHPDHAAAAYFVRQAQLSYTAPHRLRAYQGYDVSSLPENVSGSLLTAKRKAFLAYAAHDFEVCDSRPECEESFYGEWLLREYVAASETTGVVADAGFGRVAAAGAEVTLDGSESSAESGAPLAYEWTQVRGPAVQIAGAETAEPTFTVPWHPTLLTFSLTVRDGALASPPDLVDVRVPSEGSTPTAIAGPAQTVDSGTGAQLDQPGGAAPTVSAPAVKYGIAGTVVRVPIEATGAPPPSLSLAGDVPAGLRLVATGVGRAILVGRPAGMGTRWLTVLARNSLGTVSRSIKFVLERRPALRRRALRLTGGRRSRAVVGVRASAGARVSCGSRLPPGVSCTARRRRLVVRGSASLDRGHRYRLSVLVRTRAGVVRLPLVVRVAPPTP